MPKLAFLGAGKMASAIVDGILAKKAFAPADLACTDGGDGTAAGLDRDTAWKLAMETVLGSARLMARTGTELETLRDQVTSPNGTTYAGLMRMKARDFRGLIKETVLAATARSEELSKDT